VAPGRCVAPQWPPVYALAVVHGVLCPRTRTGALCLAAASASCRCRRACALAVPAVHVPCLRKPMRALLAHRCARASAQRASADPRGSAPCAAAQPSTRQAADGASSSSAGNGRVLEPLHELAGLSLNGARSPDLLDAPAAKPVLEAAGWGAMSAGGAVAPRQHVALPQPAAPAAPNRLRVFSGTSNMVRRDRARRCWLRCRHPLIHTITLTVICSMRLAWRLLPAGLITCARHFQASVRARAARPVARRARGASRPLMRFLHGAAARRRWRRRSRASWA